MAQLGRLILRTTSYTVTTFVALSALDYSYMTIKPVAGPSMSPTLNAAVAHSGATDRVAILRFRPHAPLPWKHPDLQRGDVVYFRKPNKPAEMAIKRVVGVAGDRIVRDPRRVALGAPFRRKHAFGEVPSELVVPPGQIFVEGDNWKDSTDSNDFGCLPVNMVAGTAVSRSESYLSLLFGMGESIPDRPKNRWSSRTRVIEPSVTNGPGQGREMLDEWSENAIY